MRACVFCSLHGLNKLFKVLRVRVGVRCQCHECVRGVVHFVPLHDIALAEVGRDQAFNGPFCPALAFDLLGELDRLPFFFQTHAGGVVPVNIHLPRQLVTLRLVEVVDLVPRPDRWDPAARWLYERIHGLAECDRCLVVLHEGGQQFYKIHV